MKRITSILALTVGLSAFTALGQSQGDQASQFKNAPARKDGEEIRKQDRRGDERSLRRGKGPRQQRGDQFARPQMRRQAPAFNGPSRRFAPGQGLGAQGPGPAWGNPQAGPQQRGPRREVCPHCNRPFDLGAARGPQFREGHGFGPRPDAGPMGRGLGPQARGPAFGPPPWAGRGGPGSDMRSGPRGPGRERPPLPERGFGPMRRGPDGPDAPAGRFDRPGPGPRAGERGLRNAPPAEPQDR